MTESARFRASAALAAYVEPLIEGRRVVVFGDATSGLGQHLLDRGARLVHLYDPDRARVAAAGARASTKGLTLGPLEESGLAVRDGAFDVGLVEDLSALADPAAALRWLRRAVAARGTVLVASPNPEARLKLLPEPGGPGLDYTELFDLVGAHFEEVRMVGQTPFVGYAVVDFGTQADDPEPAFDTGFLPTGAEEADWFVAVGSSQAADLEPFVVVQLPFRAVLGGERARAVAPAPTVDAGAGLRERVAALEAELTAARVSAASQQAAHRLELERKEAWLLQLEERAAAADARADAAEAEVELLRGRDEASPVAEVGAAREREARLLGEVERLGAALGAAEAALGRAEKARGAAEAAASAARAARAEAEGRAAELAARAEGARREPEVSRADGARTEAARRELEAARGEATLARREAEAARREAEGARRQAEARAAEQERLEQALAQAGERVKALGAELRAARAAAEEPAAAADLERLEAQLRERGGEVARLTALHAAAVRVGKELLAELEAARAAGGADPGREAELVATLDRLAARNAGLEADLTALRWQVESERAPAAPAAH